MVDPYSFPPQLMAMPYQHPPPPQMGYPAPPFSPYGPPTTDPNIGTMSGYGPPPGPDPNMYAYPVPQFRPPPSHMHPGPMMNRQPPPPQPQPFQNFPPRHGGVPQPQYDADPPPRRGHSEVRHRKPKKVRHKRSATSVDNLDLRKSFRGRSHDKPRRKSKTPDYYETLKGPQIDDVPATRTKPSQNPNAMRYNDTSARETIRRKVEFEEQTQARYFYMDDMPPQHGGKGVHVQDDMHRLMKDQKLSDFGGPHQSGGGLSHSIPHRDIHVPPRHTNVPREPSYQSHAPPNHHSNNPNHILREPSNHIHREPSNPDHLQPDSSLDFDPSKAADDTMIARASKRYFVEDEYFIDRMGTIEAEKYRVQGSDDPITDQRLVNRYPSYASSNPYIGTLPDDNFQQPRGAEEFSA